MKSILTFLLFGLLIPSVTLAQSDESKTRQHLSDLVKERKDRFEKFNEAIETRSGIFGNQTKKDLKSANEVLVDIVKTDNRIIFELQRLLDHKNFEKTTKNIQEQKDTEKTERYLTAIDNLNAKNAELKKINEDLSKKAERSSLLNWIFIPLAISMTILVYTWSKKRKAKQTI